MLVRSFVIFATLGLTACGGSAVVPPQSSGPSSIPFTASLVPDITDPCQTLSKEGLWYFHGSCLGESVKSKATLFKLKSYKGILQTLHFPAVSGSVHSGTKIVAGEGTNTKDITGKFQGTKFPFYASSGVQCVNQYGSATGCAGKAVIYDLLVNDSENSVTWTGSPSIMLESKKAFKHKKNCTLNQMISEGGWAYQLTPVTGLIKKGKVTLPVFSMSFGISAHTLEVLAVSCQ